MSNFTKLVSAELVELSYQDLLVVNCRSFDLCTSIQISVLRVFYSLLFQKRSCKSVYIEYFKLSVGDI